MNLPENVRKFSIHHTTKAQSVDCLENAQRNADDFSGCTEDLPKNEERMLKEWLKTS